MDWNFDIQRHASYEKNGPTDHEAKPSGPLSSPKNNHKQTSRKSRPTAFGAILTGIGGLMQRFSVCHGESTKTYIELLVKHTHTIGSRPPRPETKRTLMAAVACSGQSLQV